ncbi:extracellular solute-binding protein [Thioclava sp. GXIMD4216]|uniref:ABC transporter substrate-binding protein n=1 Tax=unclassified Thioclava TaxID=2621713 RepID=UPI0030CCF2C3
MTDRLRILTTEIQPWRRFKDRAEADLGFELDFIEMDFVNAQRIAAMSPHSYDVYDQCFHNLDIVWHWRAIQPIEIDRITYWSEMESPALDPVPGSLGYGDVPATRLWVQADASLSARPGRQISMLPTVYNYDSFAIDIGATGLNVDSDVTSWAELLDPRWHGRVALVDDPGIGVFDLVQALMAADRMKVADPGNMTVAEIDEMAALGLDLVASGHLAPFWRRATEPLERFRAGELAISSLWSPTVVAMKEAGLRVRQAVPEEGYRAWHGGMCLARHLEGARLDRAYAWLNWYLSGIAGAQVARQGYYMSVPGRVRDTLPPAEWDYWYEGRAAATDLPGPNGHVAVRKGDMRSGGSVRARSKNVAVWNSTMDEHNYLVRRWTEIITAAAQAQGRGSRKAG